MQNREGQTVPDATFRCRKEGAWLDLTSQDVFKGKSVVLFALPGAFTPTCSSSHLPRYNELASTFAEHGVDGIYCLAVNDGFVMEAWGREQKAANIDLLADGNGSFTRAMGMLVDKEDLGFGQRSWRYSMLVRDAVIEKMFIEADEPGDPFQVSDADTMLAYIDPQAVAPEPVALFSKVGCPHCAKAKGLLDEAGLVYEEIIVGRDASQSTLSAVTGASTVPQVFIGGQLIGGAAELTAYFA